MLCELIGVPIKNTAKLIGVPVSSTGNTGTWHDTVQEPAARLATLEAAGEEGVPFTTGLLIGIGETRGERLDCLFAIRALHERFGHIQVGFPTVRFYVLGLRLKLEPYALRCVNT